MEIANGSLLTGTHTRSDDANTSVLLKRDGHRVLRKRFEPGQGMAPHHAPHDVLAVVLSGEMRITVADEANTYVAGDYVIFPAGTEHSLECLQAAQVLIYL
jgi:quercetin dioxygenase-like cupin family protein